MRPVFNILLAEDSSDDVLLMQHAFERAGVVSRLLVVPDGLQALAYLYGEGNFGDRAAYPLPDILLLDLGLPGMSGFELLARLRRDTQFRHLAVHVLTNSSQDEDAQRARDLGASSYVLKPNSAKELTDFVSALHYWHQVVTVRG